MADLWSEREMAMMRSRLVEREMVADKLLNDHGTYFVDDGGYSWRQTLEEIEIHFVGHPVGPGQAKTAHVTIGSGHLKVMLGGRAIFDDDLWGPVRPSESTWVVEDGILRVELQKVPLEPCERNNWPRCGRSEAHKYEKEHQARLARREARQRRREELRRQAEEEQERRRAEGQEAAQLEEEGKSRQPEDEERPQAGAEERREPEEEEEEEEAEEEQREQAGAEERRQPEEEEREQLGTQERRQPEEEEKEEEVEGDVGRGRAEVQRVREEGAGRGEVQALDASSEDDEEEEEEDRQDMGTGREDQAVHPAPLSSRRRRGPTTGTAAERARLERERQVREADIWKKGTKAEAWARDRPKRLGVGPTSAAEAWRRHGAREEEE